ncbi:hypothetical protein AB1R77_001503 [Neisseria gonorrhoeae]
MPSDFQTAFSFGDFEMTVKLKAPEGFTDVSFGSQSYAVDEAGIVEVPSEAAEFLYQFGFGNVASEPVEAAEAEPVEAAEAEPVEEPEKAKRGRKPKTEQPAEQPAEQAEPAEAAESAEPVEAEPVEAEKAE